MYNIAKFLGGDRFQAKQKLLKLVYSQKKKFSYLKSTQCCIF